MQGVSKHLAVLLLVASSYASSALIRTPTGRLYQSTTSQRNMDSPAPANCYPKNNKIKSIYCERKEMLMNVSASATLMACDIYIQGPGRPGAFEVLWCMHEFIEVARDREEAL